MDAFIGEPPGRTHGLHKRISLFFSGSSGSAIGTLGALHPDSSGFVGRGNGRMNGCLACPRATPVKLVATPGATSLASNFGAWSARNVDFCAVDDDRWPNVVDVRV